jgi:ankyrin repeat protein/Tfp pilus assembly protein PilF
MYDAVVSKDVVRVRQLLEHGASVNARGEYQRTPLHWAANYSTIEVVALLIEKGANVRAVDGHQYTPLHFAAESGNTEVAKLLIEKGADVNARSEYRGTPLHRAAGQGMVDVSALLIQKGADINARDWMQDTPLHVAAEYGDSGAAGRGNTGALVKLLIEKGADVNARNGTKATPLHKAAEETYGSSMKVAALLIEKGADLNARDNTGDTPAMVAEKKGKTELVALLRKTGGSSTRQDFDAKIQKIASAGVVYHDDLQVILRLAKLLTPPPVVPGGAQDEMTKGKAAFKLARRLEEFKDAEEHFRKVSILAPWLPEPYFNLAVTQERQGKWDNAKYSFESYLIAAPDAMDAPMVKQKLAELDIQKRRWEDCEQEDNIGIVLYKKGPSEYTDAIRHWKRAVELCAEHPNLDSVYYNLGEVYMNQGLLDDAYRYMQQAFDLNPNTDVGARYTNMGVVLERRGDRSKACTYYKKACDFGSQVGCRNQINVCQ